MRTRALSALAPLIAPVLAVSLLAGTGAAAAQTAGEPLDHPVLRLEDPERWTTHVRIFLSASPTQSATRTGVQTSTWTAESMSIILPIITTTGSAVGDVESAKGTLTLDGRVADDTPTIIGPYQGQAMYARLEALNARIDGMRAEITQNVVSYETVYDEQLAMTLGWPSAWPPEADSTFQPQQLISEVRSGFSNDGPVNDLVREWTNGQDPTSIPPAQLAKYLASKVWDHVRLIRPAVTSRPSDDGTVIPINRVAGVEGRTRIARGGAAGLPISTGFVVQHVDATATSGQGSENDLPLLLCAVYRAAGLPARVVIGYRERTEDEQNLSQSDRHRAWVEFALFDPQARGGQGQLIWVPVDIVELKKSSSRSRPIDRPWKFFGTHDELDDTVPVATHFHPPTTVRSYSVPALYGWTTTPEPPDRAAQSFDINISGTVIRGDDNRNARPAQRPQRRRGRP